MAKTRIAKTKIRSLVTSAVTSREVLIVPVNNPVAWTYTWIALQIIAGTHPKREASTPPLDADAGKTATQKMKRATIFPGVGRFGLGYHRIRWWAVQDSNLRPPACKAGALTS